MSRDDEGFDACPEPTCPLYGKAVMADHRHLPGRSRRVPSWCGAGLYTPVMGEDGRIVAESRRMCGLKEPHEWHQDRFDKTVRWRALPPLAERAPKPSEPTATDGRHESGGEG